MKVLRMNGGHRFRLHHSPTDDIGLLKPPVYVAFSARGLRFLKPKVLVGEGDEVALGQPLVCHKKNPQIVFTSPASGKVHEIRYGERRVLEEIVIALDSKKEEEYISSSKKQSQEEIEKLSRDEVEKHLLSAGLWPYLQCFPTRDLAPIGSDSKEKISAVHINLVSTEAHLPNPIIATQRYLPEMALGIKILSKLAKTTRIYALENATVPVEISNAGQVIRIENKYPAEIIGVQSYYSGVLEKNHVVVGADCELVMDIGHWFMHARKRTERTFSLAGNAAKNPKHFRGRIGMAVGDIVNGELSTLEDVRLIAGGLFRGKKIRYQDHLGENDVGVQAYIEDKKRIPLVFFRLGLNKLTLSRTWASGFNTTVMRDATTSNNGEERACIQCGYCIDICPVKLLPNLIMKAAVTDDIERMEYLSISDCVECGLCTFVCPSKIELGQAIDSGKRLIEKEG